MRRRDFIVQTAMAGISCTLAGSLLQGCKTAFHVPNRLSPKGDKIFINTADLKENPFAIVRNEKLPGPVYLLKKPGGKYIAVLMICTHKGCEVKPSGGYLICPCHGSEFSGEGKVLNPPAEKDLFTYKVTVESDLINISL